MARFNVCWGAIHLNSLLGEAITKSIEDDKMAEIKFGTGGFGASVRVDDYNLCHRFIEDFARNGDKGEEIMLSKEDFQKELDKSSKTLEDAKQRAKTEYQAKRLSLFASRNTQLSNRVDELEGEVALHDKDVAQRDEDYNNLYERYLDKKIEIRDYDNSVCIWRATSAILAIGFGISISLLIMLRMSLG